MKQKTKQILSSTIIIILILITIFFSYKYITTGSLSVTGLKSNVIESDTQIECSTTQDCVDNKELLEIKSIVYCDSTCKFTETIPQFEGGK